MAQCTRSASLSEFSDTGARDPDPAIDVDIKRQGSPALRHISQLAQRGGVGRGGVAMHRRWIRQCAGYPAVKENFPQLPVAHSPFTFTGYVTLHNAVNISIISKATNSDTSKSTCTTLLC
jgi:hypothetical protein